MAHFLPAVDGKKEITNQPLSSGFSHPGWIAKIHALLSASHAMLLIPSHLVIELPDRCVDTLCCTRRDRK